MPWTNTGAMARSCDRSRSRAQTASPWLCGRQLCGAEAKIWIVSAPISAALSMHRSSAPDAETCAPTRIMRSAPPACASLGSGSIDGGASARPTATKGLFDEVHVQRPLHQLRAERGFDPLKPGAVDDDLDQVARVRALRF